MALFCTLPLAWSLLAFYGAVTASTFPPPPTGVTEFVSQRWSGARISYKKVCDLGFFINLVLPPYQFALDLPLEPH